MPEYSDIYVISDKRDENTVEGFLDQFLLEREESADEYEVPRFLEFPDIVFSKAFELVKYCSTNKNVEHSIYWRALNEKKPEHGMVFYLKDGNVIYGLSTDASNSSYAQDLLLQLQKYLGSSLGYIGHEASPDVENLNGFKQAIESHKP